VAYVWLAWRSNGVAEQHDASKIARGGSRIGLNKYGGVAASNSGGDVSVEIWRNVSS